MADWPASGVGPALVSRVSTMGPNALGPIFATLATGLASAAWGSANRATFVPFRLPCPVTVTRLFHHNGATASGNLDVGIYDAAGTRLVSSGSTAQSGTNAIQEFDVTDTVIGPGQFYFAVAMDGTTGTSICRAYGDPFNVPAGIAIQTSAFALPATATLATTVGATNVQVPHCGLISAGGVVLGVDQLLPPLPTITPWHAESIGHGIVNLAGNGADPLDNVAAATYPSANLAIYAPFFVLEPVLVKRLFISNGGNVTGNIDMGLYDHAGTRLVSSGSTARSGTWVFQSFDITDTWIGPGLFYLAAAMDNTTGTLYRSDVTAVQLAAMGVKQQASAFALPAAATFADMAQAYLPVMGLTTRSFI